MHTGSRWADLHAEAELLEESKKCVLATITLHYMNDGNTKSGGETMALAAGPHRALLSNFQGGIYEVASVITA